MSPTSTTKFRKALRRNTSAAISLDNGFQSKLHPDIQQGHWSGCKLEKVSFAIQKNIQTIHFGFPTLSFSGLSFWFSHELRIEFEFCSLPGFFDIHMKQKSHLRTHEMLVAKGFPFQE